MAGWVDEIYFDPATYATGDLGGQDGWTLGGANLTVTTAQSANGTQSVVTTANANSHSKRNITAVDTNGSFVYFSARASSVGTIDNASLDFYNGDGTNLLGLFALNSPAATNVAWRNGTDNVIFTIAANTWYRFGVEFDFTNDRARFNVDGGSFSAYYAFNVAVTSCNHIRLSVNNGDGGSANYYFDYISATYSAGGGGRQNRLATLGVG